MIDAVYEFKKYTAPYLEINKMCILKVNHTLRVVELCEKIATSLRLSDSDIELAKLCGLLHDIARFEQWKQFETFSDKRSFDHGDYGVKILEEDNFIRKFNKNPELDGLILKAVKNHNKYKIEDGLTELEKLFCNIVRDADKIDIVYLYSIGELTVSLDDDCISDGVHKRFLNSESVLITDRVTKADKLATSLAFVFDINYDISASLIMPYLNEVIDLYDKQDISLKLREQLGDIRRIINEYIDRRCKNVR